MYVVVKKTLTLSGKMTPPGSKSLSIRSLLFALLAQGKSTLFNVLESDDTKAAIAVCEALGAIVQATPNTLSVLSKGLPLDQHCSNIHTGNSGITTLFTLPLLGLRKNYTTPIQVDCGEQMRARPIQSLVKALTHLGMEIQYLEHDDRLPISIAGQLNGGRVEVDGINSQYLSALLISLPCAPKDSVITVNNLHERSYVEMTLDYLKEQGIDYSHQVENNLDIFCIRGNQHYAPINHTIRGDFSSASCLIAAATLIANEVELNGLDYTDAQGDKKLISILKKMGADITIDKEKLKIKGNKPLIGISIDANDIPDLVPALAVIATQASGKTEILNVPQARIKETDRIHSMTEGLRKMGAKIEEHTDGITVYPSKLQGALINGYGDHRTVMAFTIAGMLAEGVSLITDSEAINKTYPHFFVDLQSLGANIMPGNYNANNHIILIGFKHVGKTQIGRQLAKTLTKPFVDLDHELENLYEQLYFKNLACRDIMQTHGEIFYRDLENQVLRKILKLPACVISLGGGTLLNPLNQELIKQDIILHVIAPRGIVFERIMVEGRPAFFDPHEEPYDSFSRLWDERNHVYQKLSTCTVNNNRTIEQAVNEALAHVHNQQGFRYA